jgi:3-oxoacyl-[acyl-carrier-protein] synthase-3
MMRAGIIGLGIWVPSEVRRNDAWPASFRQKFSEKREARKAVDLMHVERHGQGRPHEDLLERYTAPYENDPFKGTVERRVAPPEMLAVEGEAVAARRAIEDAGLDPRDISFVFSSAVVPDRVCPPNATAIQHLTGCVNAPALGVEAFCGSPPAHLELAAAMIEAGRAKYILCVHSHVISRAMELTHPASPVFGDAAAAFIVGGVAQDRGLIGVASATDGSLAGAVTWNDPRKVVSNWWCPAPGPVYLGADEPEALRRLVDNALAYPIDTIRDACKNAQVPVDAVAAIAMIQPLAWYQAAVAEGLGISGDRIPSTHSIYAHIGGVGVVVNLLEARERGLLQDGSLAVLYGHGAGMTRYATVLRWGGRI